jgi:chemotaxis protein CheX
MDAKYINPFIESFKTVMPQLGFNEVKIGKLSALANEINCQGVVIVLGFIGSIKGNVVYRLDIDSAKHISSAMMMGMEVEDFDEIAKSALSELTNMLTATAATFFAEIGVSIEISTPTMLEGLNMTVNMKTNQILCIELLADNVPVEVYVSFE